LIVMDVEISYLLSAGKNADAKYLLRNKYKQKLKGLERAIAVTKEKLKNIEQESRQTVKPETIKATIEKKWYEKFRWFFTTSNFLVVGGRDSKNNELLVKKHMVETDLYFHADIHGAPHVILKSSKAEDVPEEDRREAANFAGMYSSAWKSKIFSVDVYSTSPEQVTKTANTGESVGTGAFVIRGKREYFRKLDLTCGIGYDEKLGIIAGPYDAINKKTNVCFKLIPGDDRKSKVVGELKRRFEKKGIATTTEEIDAMLPPGDCKLFE
jgi:predicted ribosome quality control (RQC) complex YloA/Tae2 family protein